MVEWKGCPVGAGLWKLEKFGGCPRWTGDWTGEPIVIGSIVKIKKRPWTLKLFKLHVFFQGHIIERYSQKAPSFALLWNYITLQSLTNATSQNKNITVRSENASMTTILPHRWRLLRIPGYYMALYQRNQRNKSLRIKHQQFCTTNLNNKWNDCATFIYLIKNACTSDKYYMVFSWSWP